MILTCPECATSYFVDDSRIAAAGRTVKCSNCGAKWTALPEGVAKAPAPAPKPAPAPAPPPPAITPVDELVIDGPEPAATPAKTKSKAKDRRAAAPGKDARSKVMIWAGSALVAALLIAGVIVFRASIVQMLPASQAAYAGLGLKVSSLAIENVHAEPAFQGGRAVLSVTGEVHNLGAAPQTVPALRVTLLDRLGKPVAVKVAKPIDGAAPGHAVRYFAITLVDPPASLHDLDVAFEAAGKGAAKPVKASVSPPTPDGPEPAEARPLPAGSPDALPSTPR